MIMASTKEFAEILDRDASGLMIFDGPKPAPNVLSPTRWSPPPSGTVKLTTNAVRMPFPSKLGTFAWVARDVSGTALKAACSSPSVMSSDLTAEAEAIRSAIYGAIEAGWDRIIIESSYKPLLSIIEGSSVPDSRVFSIVMEIRNLCPYFQSIAFSVLPMALNTVDSLANHGFTFDEPQIWDEIPDWLLLEEEEGLL